MSQSMPNGIDYDPQGWHDAGLDAYAAWTHFEAATTPVAQALALQTLNEKLGDLFTWLPGFDYATHTLTDPRGED